MVGHTLMEHELRLAYLAGFVDGEGCFRWDGTPRVEVTNTYPLPLVMLQNEFGGSLRARQPKDAKHRLTWVWSVCGDGARKVILELSDYLVEKLPQALVLDEMITAGPARRARLNRQLRAMKRSTYLEVG